MHVCFVNLVHAAAADPEALVEADVTRRGLAEALVARGHAVSVVQEAPWRARVGRDGVRWELVPPSARTVRLRGVLAGLGSSAPIVQAPADAPLPVVRALRPDVVHSFDLAFYPSLALLARQCARDGVPLVAHFHGGAPARRPGYRAIARYALARTDRLLFTTVERGAEWVEAGLATPDRIATVFETSTFFRARDRAAARARTGLDGDPLYLCAGRLDPVKDPLTTLEGFARIARVRPDARLALAWTDAPLLDIVRRRVAQDPLLAPRVRLLGRVPHAEMEALHASADYLLQASVREVCGVAVLEALACGAVPVLTDIPPFRRLTDDGRVGRLFPVGDPVALAAQALALAEGDRAAQSRAASGWFDAALGFDALADACAAVYAEVCVARGRTVGASSAAQSMGATGTGSRASPPEESQASSSA